MHSIIAAYGLGIAPHGYYLVKMMANAKGQSSNILYVLMLALVPQTFDIALGRERTCSTSRAASRTRYGTSLLERVALI